MKSPTVGATLVALLLAACQDPFEVDGGQTRSISPRLAPDRAAVATRDAGIIAGRYIVSLRDGGDDARPRIRAAMAYTRGTLRLEYTAVASPGFVADLSDADVRALRNAPDVAAIEPDRETHGTGLQIGASWGLDRIDQPVLPLVGTYVYGGTAAGVTVLVLDTGLNFDHVEFGGRAEAGADFVGSGGADCNGHGTHVAGVAGGATYGVAKGVRLVSVRVLDCAMKGTMSQAILGLGWVAEQKRAHPATPMVANLSLEGSGASAAFDRAVTAAIDLGVTVVIAAGNSAADACTLSPARVPGAVTVAATDSHDGYAAFSNGGSCVALAAPGVAIESAWIGSDRATQSVSGTSTAAPFVAGAAALYLAQHPSARPAEVRAALVDHALSGALSGVPAGTANRLLGVSFLSAPGEGLFRPRPLTLPGLAAR